MKHVRTTSVTTQVTEVVELCDGCYAQFNSGVKAGDVSYAIDWSDRINHYTGTMKFCRKCHLTLVDDFIKALQERRKAHGGQPR